MLRREKEGSISISIFQVNCLFHYTALMPRSSKLSRRNHCYKTEYTLYKKVAPQILMFTRMVAWRKLMCIKYSEYTVFKQPWQGYIG